MGPNKAFWGLQPAPGGSEAARAARRCRIRLTFPRCLCSRGRYRLPSALSVLAGAAGPGWSLLPPQPRSRLPARLRSRHEDPAEHRGRLEAKQRRLLRVLGQQSPEQQEGSEKGFSHGSRKAGRVSA